jgi:hypothetical protein
VDHFDVDGRGHTWPQATGACRNGQLANASLNPYRILTASIADSLPVCAIYLPIVLALSSLRTRTDGTNTPIARALLPLSEWFGPAAWAGGSAGNFEAYTSRQNRGMPEAHNSGLLRRQFCMTMIKDVGPTPACQRRARWPKKEPSASVRAEKSSRRKGRGTVISSFGANSPVAKSPARSDCPRACHWTCGLRAPPYSFRCR